MLTITRMSCTRWLTGGVPKTGYGREEQEYQPPVRRVRKVFVNGQLVSERVIGGKAGGDTQRVGPADAPGSSRA